MGANVYNNIVSCKKETTKTTADRKMKNRRCKYTVCSHELISLLRCKNKARFAPDSEKAGEEAAGRWTEESWRQQDED